MSKWKIGDVTITKIIESEIRGGLEFLLPQATREALLAKPWLVPHFVSKDGELMASIHALVVETPTRRIVVDTCVGNDKTRPGFDMWDHQQTSFLKDFIAAGFAPETIDTVLCTHLHVDHVGWNTILVDGKWQPTFPNARYLFGKREFEHWNDEADQAPVVEHIRTVQVDVIADSVRPVFEAGLVDLVETDHRVCEEISLMPTVGHTPGHVSIKINSKGESAIITGDFVHHPCQMAYPGWAAAVDYDQAQSTRTRQEVFGALADTPTLVIGTHFMTPTAGHIVRDGDAFRLVV